MLFGGLILKCGLRAAAPGSTVSYPVAFPNNTLSVVLTSYGGSGAVGVAGTVNASGFGFTGNGQFYWIAIGY